MSSVFIVSNIINDFLTINNLFSDENIEFMKSTHIVCYVLKIQ